LGKWHYIDSIIFVNDKGGSISPSGTDQFPPLMSCERWVILVLEKQVSDHSVRNDICQCILTAKAVLGHGAIFGMMLLIPLEASTWKQSEKFQSQVSNA
jgi:hypothetical protein